MRNSTIVPILATPNALLGAWGFQNPFARRTAGNSEQATMRAPDAIGDTIMKRGHAIPKFVCDHRIVNGKRAFEFREEFSSPFRAHQTCLFTHGIGVNGKRYGTLIIRAVRANSAPFPQVYASLDIFVVGLKRQFEGLCQLSSFRFLSIGHAIAGEVQSCRSWIPSLTRSFQCTSSMATSYSRKTRFHRHRPQG